MTTLPTAAVPAGRAPRILRLTLKRRWFDMIASGEKKEEYREATKWTNSRVGPGRTYDAVQFRNGYRPDSPTILVQYLGFHYGSGRPEWGADPQTNYVVIELGKILSGNAQALAQPGRNQTSDTMKNSTAPAVDQQRLVRLGEYIAIRYDAEEIVPKTAQDAERQPCPFCGDTTTGFTRNQGHQVIHCLNCGAMGPMMREKADNWNENDHRTLALWNARISREQSAEWYAKSQKPNTQSQAPADATPDSVE